MEYVYYLHFKWNDTTTIEWTVMNYFSAKIVTSAALKVWTAHSDTVATTEWYDGNSCKIFYTYCINMWLKVDNCNMDFNPLTVYTANEM